MPLDVIALLALAAIGVAVFCVVIWQVIDSYTIKWEAEDMLEEEYWEIVKRIREMRKDD